jgi:RimJ/RimL family protein N-acetyltransferase
MANRSTAGIVRRVRRRLWNRRELLVYRCTPEQIERLPRSSQCSRDRWEDLERCSAWSYGHLTRAEYLEVLQQRRREGVHHLYSFVENGTLVHYGWLSFPQERAPDAALGLELVPPRGSAVLWDYFTHPSARGRGLYLRTLWQCLHDAVAIDGARQVFIYVYADNDASRRVIERAGFEYQGSLVAERRILRTRRYSTYVTAPLDVHLLDTGAPAEAREDRRPMLRVEHDKERDRVVAERDRGGGRDQFGPGGSRQQPA